MPSVPTASSSGRIALSTAVAILALALSACGGGEDAAPAASGAATAQAPAGAAPAAAPATPAPAVAPASVDELLKSANLAVAEERLVSPAGNNAIEFYLAVLEQQPNNVQATQALVDLFPLGASIAEREVAQRQVDEAERIVALLDRASPGSYTVSSIRTKLDQMRETLEREEQQRLAAQQAAAAAAQQAATPAPPPTPAPTPAPAPAPEPEPEPVAAATPPPAQTPPPAPAAPVGETRDAEVLRQVPPQYPADAVRRRLEGWVELEFTVGADGRVSNVSVARAQPARVFDREAVRAMQQWTFRPALRDGQPVESRGRRRMEFKLNS